MTLEEINKLYENVNEYDSLKFVLISIALSFIIAFIGRIILNSLMGEETGSFSIPIITIICIIISALLNIHNESEVKENMKEWRKTVKIEYINKLPKERYEVIEYKVMGGRTGGDKLNVEFTYMFNNIEMTEKMKVIVKPVENIEKPYITFQFLNKNLPLNEEESILDKGYYNSVLYVPE